MNNLGIIHRRQGALEQAEATYQQALTAGLKAFGPDHMVVLDTLNNLGCLYEGMGQPIKAKHMYKRAMTGREKTIGPKDISSLDMANNFGALYQALGKHRKAQNLYKRAFEGYEKLLGHHHSKAQQAEFGLIGSTYRSLPRKSHWTLKAICGKRRAMAW
ncbi:tetratricopeptide repeat protein [Aspergillus alliaceus]|uniref:tetratricopeptide repeat protein n=1 Tax=Petromyces alliaceus TaxID=209559 RepID=UPI0012A65DAB|nr:Tetratricopeptide repeat-domain-containing protein [Aspergillus alliaceus]KAB8229476.1 Tetratricopeptide repeat-domain-containing protein [Aspergillus alliaceus]